jgi:O6-methylguanine-DNA--protein-cysteine methyltransferase
MPAPLRFKLPDDFAARCSETRRRTDAGETMTVQQLADALGLPFEFIGAALAITEALATGRPILVDPAAAPLPN